MKHWLEVAYKNLHIEPLQESFLQKCFRLIKLFLVGVALSSIGAVTCIYLKLYKISQFVWTHFKDCFLRTFETLGNKLSPARNLVNNIIQTIINFLKNLRNQIPKIVKWLQNFIEHLSKGVAEVLRRILDYLTVSTVKVLI